MKILKFFALMVIGAIPVIIGGYALHDQCTDAETVALMESISDPDWFDKAWLSQCGSDEPSDAPAITEARTCDTVSGEAYSRVTPDGELWRPELLDVDCSQNK